MVKAQSNKKVLTHNGKELSDAKIIADTFAHHFLNAHNHEQPNFEKNSDHTVSDAHIHIEHFTEKEIAQAILDIPEKKPPGTDGLPAILFKKCSQSLKSPITHLINSSIQSCEFPTILKEALVKAVPKKSSLEISEHRPISILNTLSKIYECALYNKIANFVFSSISPHQHGFVSRKSTLTNLTEFCDYTAKALSSKDQVDVLYCDAMKCFDSLHHLAIKQKLEKAGFSSPLVKLIFNYLGNRKNTVLYENQKSSSFTPPSGVVQGSKLSSLLFILTFDDVRNHIRHSEYKMYADDIKIYKIVRNQSDCEKLQEDFVRVQDWMKSIGLTFHPKKCYKMSYSTLKSKIQYTYHIGDINLQDIETYSDLGVILTNDLTWNNQINNVTSKAYCKLGMIIRFCQNIQNPDAILILYKAIVRSTLEYCSVVWTPKTETNKKAIEKVQACFVRYLFQKLNGFYPKYPHNIGYKTLIENLPIESIETRHGENQLKYLRNIFTYRLNSSELTSNISFRIPNPRLRIDPNILFSVSNNTNHLKSPTMSAMKHYNELDQKPDIFNLQS